MKVTIEMNEMAYKFFEFVASTYPDDESRNSAEKLMADVLIKRADKVFTKMYKGMIEDEKTLNNYHTSCEAPDQF